MNIFNRKPASRGASTHSAIWFAGSFFLALLVVPAAKPQVSGSLFAPERAQALDAELQRLITKNNLPSLEVAIEVPGKGEYSFVGGLANLKTGNLRTRNQPYRIASITKPFAATAILVLVDRGQLKKTDTVSKWFPAFPYAEKITVDDLLRMRSGIPAPNDDEVLARVYDAPLAPAPSFAEEMRSYEKLRPQFKPPDTVGVYTDFNYDILAAIAERVTGKDIGSLITDTVITPLTLSHTTYPTGNDVPGGLRGYGWNPSKKSFEDKTLFSPPLAGAAGAIISNAADMHTFARAVCLGKLLTPATFKAQFEGKPLEGTNAVYGEGIAMGPGVCGHSGTIDGYSSEMYYFDKLDASLVINVNRLDRDNQSRSAPVLDIVSQFLLANLKPSAHD